MITRCSIIGLYSFCHNYGSRTWALVERKLLLEGPNLHFHDYGRQGISVWRNFFFTKVDVWKKNMEIVMDLFVEAQNATPSDAKVCFCSKRATGFRCLRVGLSVFKRMVNFASKP